MSSETLVGRFAIIAQDQPLIWKHPKAVHETSRSESRVSELKTDIVKLASPVKSKLATAIHQRAVGKFAIDELGIVYTHFSSTELLAFDDLHNFPFRPYRFSGRLA
jgi:hypothetical protein